MKKKNKIILTIAVIVFLAALIGSCFKIIPTGYTGVKSTFGQVDPDPVQPGFVFKLPAVQTIENVNNKQQDCTVYSRIWAETSNRTAIYYENVIVTYQISSAKSTWLVSNVSDYRNSIVTDSVVASAIKTASKELADIDATNRGRIEPLAQEKLQAILDGKYGENTIYINRITITNIDFDDSYNEAIAQKQTAQLAYERQAIENKTAIEKAEAEAEVKKKEAQGEAEALKIRAEAEAEANRTISESLTDKVLANKYYEVWDGKLPAVTGDSSVILPSELFGQASSNP